MKGKLRGKLFFPALVVASILNLSSLAEGEVKTGIVTSEFEEEGDCAFQIREDITNKKYTFAGISRKTCPSIHIHTRVNWRTEDPFTLTEAK